MDECEEESKRPMTIHLMELARACTGGRLKLFVTSRPEPWLISINKAAGETIRSITLQDFNHNDLRSYINTRVRFLQTSHQEYLKGKLISRSDGVFLWAKLVIDMLEKIVFGASLSELQEKLDSVPDELTELYNEKMKGLSDNERTEAVEVFRWVILAKRPLSCDDLRYALAISIHKVSSIKNLESSDKVQGLSDTEDRIRKYSGGLLEVRSGTVQVIHQSVKDFFLSTDHPLRIGGSISQTRLAVTCVSFLSFTDIEYPLERRLSPYARAWIGHSTPLFNYSRDFWVTHSKAGDLRDSCYVNAMRGFLWSPILERLIDFYDPGRWSEFKNSIKPQVYIVYYKNLFQLARDTTPNNVFKDIPNLSENCLLAAILFEYEDEVRLCIESGADLNAQLDRKYGNALQAAATRNGNLNIVKFLIDSGADVNAQGGEYGNSLQAAAVYGTLGLVKFLIENGADVNAQGGCHESALQTTINESKQDIESLLRNNGAKLPSQIMEIEEDSIDNVVDLTTSPHAIIPVGNDEN